MVTTNNGHKRAEELYSEFRNHADAGNISETLYALEKMKEFKIPCSQSLYDSTMSTLYSKATEKSIKEMEKLYSCISRVYSCAVEKRPGKDLVSHKIPLKNAISRIVSARTLVNDYHRKHNVYYDKAYVDKLVRDSFEKAIEIKLTRAKGFWDDCLSNDTQRELNDAKWYSKSSGIKLPPLYDELQSGLKEGLSPMQIAPLLPGIYETKLPLTC
jgi:hypothetical protein